MATLPTECPSCGQRLLIKKLACQECMTEIEGVYEPPVLASVSRADQAFIVEFVKASGSLKEMARLSKVSYPTVRNRLDDIIGNLRRIEERQKEETDGTGA